MQPGEDDNPAFDTATGSPDPSLEASSMEPHPAAVEDAEIERPGRFAWLAHGSFRIPVGVIEGVRRILLSDDPARLRKAFECATYKAFRCMEVIRQTETRFVCMARRIDIDDIDIETLPLRATMTVDRSTNAVRSIVLERMD